MASPNGVLGVVDDPSLRDDVDRVAAAVGVRVVHRSGPPSRRDWAAAAAVVVDQVATQRCVTAALPRRSRVILLAAGEPTQATWQAAVSLGAQHVLRLPEQERELVAMLADADDEHADAHGRVLSVVGGRGGAGASIFSAALAIAAGDALLVDVDCWGGGLDLLLGIERQPGLRWPDVALENGRIGLSAIRAALPCHRTVGVLSATRRGGDVAEGALVAVVDAGRRGGVTVVCDVPRRLTAAAEAALDAADLVVVVGTCDVRSSASMAAMAPALVSINPNVGLVIRGPAPGGLSSADVARAAGLPLLATMRPEPNLAARLERGGLRLGRRSALCAAARRVIALLERRAVPVVA